MLHVPGMLVVLMQRSKPAVSVEMKQVIGALCRLLAATGLEAVPTPEIFRQAKFGGGTEVEEQFWQLLTNVLQKANIVSCEARAQLGGASEHRKLTAAGLWQTSYHAHWMYGREGGEGGRLSSRDLLMALGWLLATGALERLLTQRIKELDKTLLTCMSVSTQLSNGLQLDPASLKTLQWFIGSLRHQGRILLSIQEEQTGLLHSVLFAILSSLESSDQSSTVLKEDRVCMCQLCDLLQAYVSWREVEKVFWTWMDSVVDCCLTDTVVEKSAQAPDGSPGVCHHGIWGLQKLDEMLLRLPTGQVSYTCKKGQSRGKGDAENRGEGGERLQGGPYTSSLPPVVSSLPSLPSIPQVYRVRLLTERSVNLRNHPAERVHGGARAPDKLSWSDATLLLLQIEALLLDRRDRQRLVNRMQLQEIVGRLDELVLIPP
ncbi:tubulin epsilon and delta complex protein 1 isoform X2 [Acanthopagrus latus]|uniref:tubulin epsilon and delta complex protein 1 isoform X2 n=1 Tax=Acanthopagrus latus TaxID=8177 RepID=UPI00187C5050|nr:tubulin epsilon and delta complex protein 1 isoform X2 [Acanthopagrus latus]